MMDKPEKLRFLSVLSIVLTTIGIIALVFYLRNVENGASVVLLVEGSIILAVGNALSFLTVTYHKAPFFFVVFITSLFLMTIYDIRFNILQGSDIVWEYTSSKVTMTTSTWSIGRAAIGDRYFTAASISLYPAIVSKITSLNLIPLFQWVFRAVLALIPLALFQTVREIFGDIRLAALSALVFIQFYYNFNLLNFLIRQGVAELFLILTIYALVRAYKGKDSLANMTLAVLSIVGLVVTHYTMDYWSVIVFAGIFLLCAAISRFPRQLSSLFKVSGFKGVQQVISSQIMIFFVGFSLFWIYFTNSFPFLIDIHNEIYLVTSQIRATPGAVSATTPTSSWFFNNPAGPVIGFWFDLSMILIPIGLLYLIFRYDKKPVHMPWVIGGLVMLGFLAVWVVLGKAMLGLFLDRVISMGSPFFATFIALSILVFCAKLATSKKKVFKGLAVALPLMFLVINVPMNMVVPSYQRYLLYQPTETVNPETAINQNIIWPTMYGASAWLDQHIIENETYWAGFTNGWFYSSYRMGLDYSEEPPNNTTGTYFLLDYYNLHFGLWQGPLNVIHFPVNDVLSKSSVVFSNGDAAIIAKAQNGGT